MPRRCRVVALAVRKRRRICARLFRVFRVSRARACVCVCTHNNPRNRSMLLQHTTPATPSPARARARAGLHVPVPGGDLPHDGPDRLGDFFHVRLSRRARPRRRRIERARAPPPDPTGHNALTAAAFGVHLLYLPTYTHTHTHTSHGCAPPSTPSRRYENLKSKSSRRITVELGISLVAAVTLVRRTHPCAPSRSPVARSRSHRPRVVP